MPPSCEMALRVGLCASGFMGIAAIGRVDKPHGPAQQRPRQIGTNGDGVDRLNHASVGKSIIRERHDRSVLRRREEPVDKTLVNFVINADGVVREIRGAKTHAYAANEPSVAFAAGGGRIIRESRPKSPVRRRVITSIDADLGKETRINLESLANGVEQRLDYRSLNTTLTNESLVGFEVDANGVVRSRKYASKENESPVKKPGPGVLTAGQLAIETAVRHSSYSIAALLQPTEILDEAVLVCCAILVLVFVLAFLFGRRLLLICINRKFEYSNGPLARASLQMHRRGHEQSSWQLYMDYSQAAYTPLKGNWLEVMSDDETAIQIDVLLDAVQCQKAGQPVVIRQGAVFSWEDVEQVSLSLEEEIILRIIGKRTQTIRCTAEISTDNLDWLGESWDNSFSNNQPLDRAAFQDLLRLLITHNHFRNVRYALISKFVLPCWSDMELASDNSLTELGIDSFASTIRANIGEAPITLLEMYWEYPDVDGRDTFPRPATPARKKLVSKKLSQASSFCPTSSDESLRGRSD